MQRPHQHATDATPYISPLTSGSLEFSTYSFFAGHILAIVLTDIQGSNVKRIGTNAGQVHVRMAAPASMVSPRTTARVLRDLLVSFTIRILLICILDSD